MDGRAEITLGMASRLISAFESMQFQFEPEPAGDGPTRGYASDAVIEIDLMQASSVSLLIGIAAESPARTRGAVCLATLASLLRVDFTPWLSRKINTNGFASPWKVSRTFGATLVQAEYFCNNAMLLTIRPMMMDAPGILS
jgi:hypothetical protein